MEDGGRSSYLTPHSSFLVPRSPVAGLPSPASGEYEGEMSKSGHLSFPLSPSPNAFLAEIEGWRDSLARGGQTAHGSQLTAPDSGRQPLAVGRRPFDRAIFLRICEDRGIEDYGTLQNLIGKPGVYRRLMERFEDADKRYNSGLFDFR